MHPAVSGCGRGWILKTETGRSVCIREHSRDVGMPSRVDTLLLMTVGVGVDAQ